MPPEPPTVLIFTRGEVSVKEKNSRAVNIPHL
jgi:hypothetical protein